MTLSEDFLKHGIVKFPVEDLAALSNIECIVKPWREVKKAGLNDTRLSIIKNINSNPKNRNWYYTLAKNALDEIVGNELVMQRNINLSIQLPGDDSSLLPRHKDVLQGDSPYEVVLWVPLVDCYGTKSMFFQKRYSDKDEFIDCKYGECLIFSQNYWHGNVVNETNETRWSLNCRFKSLFSPYADKKLGEFFEPIELRPATKLGLSYGV